VNVTDINMGTPTFENKKVVLAAEFMATTFKFVDRPPNAAASSTAGGGFKQ
jgi:hypothetical protein